MRDLLAAKKKVRILTRCPENVRSQPGLTVAKGDLTVPETFSEALDEVDTAFLFPVLSGIGPFAEAAREAGVRRVVLFTGAWAAGHTERDLGSWVLPRYLLREWAETAKDPSTALPVLPTVTELTGRPARTFTRWAMDHVADFTAA